MTEVGLNDGAVWPWGNVSTSLCLGFSSGTIMKALTSQGCCEGSRSFSIKCVSKRVRISWASPFKSRGSNFNEMEVITRLCCHHETGSLSLTTNWILKHLQALVISARGKWYPSIPSDTKVRGQRSLLLLLLSRFSCVQPCAAHRQQPTNLPRLWDSPGKNTGVGCH